MFEQDTVCFLHDNPFENVGYFNGHEESRESGNDGPGRSVRIVEESATKGKQLRKHICQ